MQLLCARRCALKQDCVWLEQVDDSFVTTVQVFCAKKNHPVIGWFLVAMCSLVLCSIGYFEFKRL